MENKRENTPDVLRKLSDVDFQSETWLNQAHWGKVLSGVYTLGRSVS